MSGKDEEISLLKEEVALLRGQLKAQGVQPIERFQPGLKRTCHLASLASCLGTVTIMTR